MSKLIDLTGQRFGRLTVISRDCEIIKQGTYWICQCECGQKKSVKGSHLKSGSIASCGCLKKDRRKDISGQKFGKLTALFRIEKISSNRQGYWHCRCDCGKEIDVRLDSLTNGHTQSCGCLNESKGEIKICQLLKENNIIFEREKIFEDFIYEDTGFHPKYDFYLPQYNRLIEFDGQQHYQESFWGKEEGYTLEIRQKRDKIKNQYAQKNNISLIRIPYWEIKNLTLDSLLGDNYIYKLEE